MLCGISTDPIYQKSRKRIRKERKEAAKTCLRALIILSLFLIHINSARARESEKWSRIRMCTECVFIANNCAAVYKKFGKTCATRRSCRWRQT